MFGLRERIAAGSAPVRMPQSESAVKVYRPSNSRWIPTAGSRQRNWAINQACGEDRFECFTDWFFFTHIDPVLRFWHTLGMIGGLILFTVALILWNFWSLVIALIGVFFFYGFGLIAHLLYARGSGASDPGRYHRSTRMTLAINLWTALGIYRKKLEAFLQKYPFVVRELDLKAVETSGVWAALTCMLRGRRSSAEVHANQDVKHPGSR